MTFLDTHVVVWLYAGQVERFPKKARQRLEQDALTISPIVLLEIEYLYELRRLSAGPALIAKELEKILGLTIAQDGFESVVLGAIGHRWTRDPFDRIIVGQAQINTAPLITKDRSIHSHYKAASWE